MVLSCVDVGSVVCEMLVLPCVRLIFVPLLHRELDHCSVVVLRSSAGRNAASMDFRFYSARLYVLNLVLGN